MSLFHRAAAMIKRLMLGRHDIRQQCVLGMNDPQDETAVELYGPDESRDVRNQHTLSSAALFSVCISLENEQIGGKEDRLSPRFREKSGSKRLLGELALHLRAIVPLDHHKGSCFTVSSCKNYCPPQLRLWACYFHAAYVRRHHPRDLHLSSRDVRAMPIFFICPRPVGLLSVGGVAGNMFPVSPMGPLGDRNSGFALNSTGHSMTLVKRAGLLALSRVPLEQASVIRHGSRYGKSHVIDCAPSSLIPEDEHYEDGLQFFMIHGIYQACRQPNN